MVSILGILAAGEQGEVCAGSYRKIGIYSDTNILNSYLWMN